MPIGEPDGWVVPVPYDFDVAGIITTRYADRLYGPQERFGTRSVRERLYVGRCDSEPYLEHVLAVFARKKDQIRALYGGQPDLDSTIAAETLEYIDEFYEVIENPSRVNRELIRNCRPDED